MTAPLLEGETAPEHPIVGLAIEATRESLRNEGLMELDDAQLKSLLFACYAEYVTPGGLPAEPGTLSTVTALLQSRIMASPDGSRLPVSAVVDRITQIQAADPALLSAVRELINTEAPKAARALQRRLGSLAERRGSTVDEVGAELKRRRAGMPGVAGIGVSRNVAAWLNELPQDQATVFALARLERDAPLTRPGPDGHAVCIRCGEAAPSGHSCVAVLDAPARVWEGEQIAPATSWSRGCLAWRVAPMLLVRIPDPNSFTAEYRVEKVAYEWPCELDRVIAAKVSNLLGDLGVLGNPGLVGQFEHRREVKGPSSLAPKGVLGVDDVLETSAVDNFGLLRDKDKIDQVAHTAGTLTIWLDLVHRTNFVGGVVNKRVQSDRWPSRMAKG